MPRIRVGDEALASGVENLERDCAAYMLDPGEKERAFIIHYKYSGVPGWEFKNFIL